MGTESMDQQLERDQQRLLNEALLEQLRMTPEERIEAHEAARQLMNDLAAAGTKLRAESK